MTFFLLKIFLITYFISILISYFSDNGLAQLKNSKFNDWSNILNGKINGDLLIMGSSRGYVSYNPEIFSKKLKLSAHNLSFNAGSFKLQLQKLEIYLKYNKHPKIIIQNIDLAYFSIDKIVPDMHQFLPFYSNKSIIELNKIYDQNFTSFSLIPLLKYNQNLKLLKLGIFSNFYQQNYKNQSTFNGFSPQNVTFKIDYHNLKKLDKYCKEKQNTAQYKSKINEILAFYKNKLNSKTQIIFVWAPEHNLRLKEKYKPIYNPIAKELTFLIRNNKNVHFVNLSNQTFLNDDHYFYDTFHLNQKGATIFSNILAYKILNIVKKCSLIR